jgi:hypothetical protein
MWVERREIGGVTCDATDCDERFDIPWTNPVDAYGHIKELARAQGWTFWRNRISRQYCRSHGPKRGHTMWEI